jgi:hypothetical protein
VSKSRAKKKQRQRTRAGSSPPPSAAPRAAAAPDAGNPAAQRRPSRLEIRDGVPRPDALWAPFPLTEIGMGVGLVLFLVGFSGAPALLVAGVGVLVVAVAELCLREHFAGFRSHSILLAMLPVTVVHLGVVVLAEVAWRGLLALAVDLGIAGALAWWLQQRFRLAQGRARLRAG